VKLKRKETHDYREVFLMPGGERDLIRAMVVLTIKDFQRKKITAKECEKFCELCGFYVSAKKLSEKLLKWNNKAVNFK
jgi:hypothetical protein